MKILRIAFQNINSLKGMHEIDFTSAPFNASSLFAITGPTGSGKSTILDVISLALFNQIPRLGKISKNEILSKGAILTRNQKEAFAHVTYKCSEGVFTSRWSISTARTGNLRDYTMEISEEDAGQLLDVKKSDVPAKNEELIGLNYNQFIKSVLLAQGEFAQLLRARKDERGELLEKITGTGIYRQLGIAAFQKHKEVSLYIKEQQREIELIQRELLEKDALKATTEELAEKEGKCAPLEKEIEALAKNLDLKHTIKNQEKEIISISSAHDVSNKEFQEFQTVYGQKLQQHEKLRDFAEELRDWIRMTKECNELNSELTAKSKRNKDNHLELEACLKEVGGLTKLEVAQEKVEAELEKFLRKVRELQDQLNEKVTDFKALQRELQTEIRELSCKFDEKNPEATKTQLEELKQESEKKIRQLRSVLEEVELDKFKEEKARLKKHLQDAQEARSQADRIKAVQAEISKVESEEEKLTSQTKQLPQKIELGKSEVTLIQEQLKNINLKKQNQLLRASMEEHRATLQDGEPCPLCGATHHPYADDLPDKNDELDLAYRTTERKLSECSTRLSGNITSLRHYENRLKELSEQKKNYWNELKQQQLSFITNYEYLGAEEITDWKQFCDRYQLLLDKLEEYEKEMCSLECVETGLPLINRMIGIKAEGKELRGKLLAIYQGEDIHSDTQRLQTRWTQLKQLEITLKEQQQELQEKIGGTSEKLRVLEEDVTSKIITEGFETIPEAGKALLPDAEYFRLQTTRDKIEKEIAKNSHSLKLLHSHLEKSREGDVEHSVEDLSTQRKEKTIALERTRNECQHLRRILLNDKERRARIETIRGQISEKEKNIRRWRILNELVGDSTGKKFNDFAQDLSLSQLLQHANIRLKDLSDRYRIDKPEGDEDDGLIAIDEHMGGQRRSVKTLSGGETFLLSLSIALALSDLASRNVEINSLFIDEGFGTLDPETLDQTLDTLEKLQAESSKTIGIISHVDSLKERIATQIQLKRNGQGYSSLHVK